MSDTLELNHQKELKDVWKKVLAGLQSEINLTHFNTWLAGTTLLQLTEESATIGISTIHAKKYLTKYESLFQSELKKITNKTIGTINYDVNNEVTSQKKPVELGPIFDQKNGVVDESRSRRAGLSARFTFENYLVSNHNQLAFAVATAIAENPGRDYNPFFLYSGVGLGKTHLVQAIGNRVLQKNNNLNVLYTTGEWFANEMIDAIQSGKGGKYKSNEFRKKFRGVDVLIIDDVQFIVGKESTQNEFFHTFNTLYMEGKQIVLTSDRPPKDFATLEKRITSRFASGIIADIQHPDLDTRIAILRTRRDLAGDPIDNHVINFIAEKITTNVRELEGAYMQVLTQAKANGGNVNIEIAAEQLGKNTNVTPQKKVNLNQILKAVCKYYDVKSEDIKGERRTRDLVIPRQVAMYLIKEITETPLMAIGEFLGGRDHSTVIHGIEKISKEIKEVGKISKDIGAVRELI